MKQIVDSSKKRQIYYLFSFFFMLMFITYLYDKGKYLQILLLSTHMVYGLKLLFPFSKFKKNKTWRIDFWIYGYSLKIFIELLFALLFLIFILKYLAPNDHPFGNNFKYFYILYHVYAIIFMILSIDIKKQANKPDKTFW